jgi:ABC-type multidrug transport system fused ATPase/permease subunit
LLILDEATSSLDAESEAQVQKAIDDLSRRMSILVIAHRLSTIKNVDKIYVLEEGKIVESGTWSELYSNGGRFSELYKLQITGPSTV